MKELIDEVLVEKDMEIETLTLKINKQTEAIETLKELLSNQDEAPPTVAPDKHQSLVMNLKSEKAGWLSNNLSWVKNDPTHRSAAYADSGDNGPATNILAQAGMWNTNDATAPHWVMIDMKEEYELTKFELTSPSGKPESPKDCELQYLSADGMGWEAAHKWTTDMSKGVEEFDFPPAIGTKWRLYVHNTYGFGNQGACVNKVRFYGHRHQNLKSNREDDSGPTGK